MTFVLQGHNYVGMMQQRPELILLLVLRNALLVGLLAWLVLDCLRPARARVSGGR